MVNQRTDSPGSLSGSSPLVIGVAGGSGSGKTTVVRRIMESIGDDQVTVLEHDRYYRDRNDLRLEERAALNYDHPDSLETDLLVRHLHELRAGRAGRRAGLRLRPSRTPADDHPRRPARARSSSKAFSSSPMPPCARLMDVKVFVDTDDDTRFIRRLQRDIAERGRTVTSVIDQYLGDGQADAPRIRRTEQALRRHHRPARRAQRRRHRHAADAHSQPGVAMTRQRLRTSVSITG